MQLALGLVSGPQTLFPPFKREEREKEGGKGSDTYVGLSVDVHSGMRSDVITTPIYQLSGQGRTGFITSLLLGAQLSSCMFYKAIWMIKDPILVYVPLDFRTGAYFDMHADIHSVVFSLDAYIL